MITINYQRFETKGFQLRLRLYQDGETKFIHGRDKILPDMLFEEIHYSRIVTLPIRSPLLILHLLYRPNSTN